MDASAGSHSLPVSPQLFQIKREDSDRPTMHKVTSRLSLRAICKRINNNVPIVTRAVLPESWGQTSVNIIVLGSNLTTSNVHTAHTCLFTFLLQEVFSRTSFPKHISFDRPENQHLTYGYHYLNRLRDPNPIVRFLTVGTVHASVE